MNQVKCVPSKTVELSMITPSLFLNLFTPSVWPLMDLCLQAQCGPPLGSPVNHRSWPLLCRSHSGDWNYVADATRPCLGLLRQSRFSLLATSVQRPGMAGRSGQTTQSYMVISLSTDHIRELRITCHELPTHGKH